jgi:HK97 family phage major capsid protein
MREALKRAQESLGKVWEEYKNYRDGMDNDLSKWTPEQRKRFDAFDVDIAKFETEVDKVQRKIDDQDREKRFSSAPGSGSSGGYGVPLLESRSNSENSWLLGPKTNGDSFNEYRKNPSGSSDRFAFNRYLEFGDKGISPDEFRSMTAGSDADGGFLVTPVQFSKDFLQGLDADQVMRRLCHQEKIKNGFSMGVPMLDHDFDDADFTVELGTGNEDSLTFGKRELRPHPMAKRVKISNTLIRLSEYSPEAIIRNRLTIKCGATEEKAMLTGDGINKPLGIFTPSNDGVRLDRDVTSVNTQTLIKADALIDTIGSLRGAYAAKATWLFHRNVITHIRKIKDDQGQYLWSPGLSAGAPALICERPYVTSEYAPSDISAGKYVGIVADFQFYWIVTAISMQIQRLNELYSATNQTGYILRHEVDGAPVMSEAFARMKMAA